MFRCIFSPIRLTYWHVFPARGFSQLVTQGGETTSLKIQHMGLLLCVCFCDDVSPPEGTFYPLGAESLVLHRCHGTHHHKAMVQYEEEKITPKEAAAQ